MHFIIMLRRVDDDGRKFDSRLVLLCLFSLFGSTAVYVPVYHEQHGGRGQDEP